MQVYLLLLYSYTLWILDPHAPLSYHIKALYMYAQKMEQDELNERIMELFPLGIIITENHNTRTSYMHMFGYNSFKTSGNINLFILIVHWLFFHQIIK